MDNYRNVSILGSFIKDKEFLGQLSHCQLIKEDCFIEAVLSAFETMSFKIAPIIFISVRPSVRVTNSSRVVGNS